eukprot:CAMPEP_0115291930 /NCGR_PEP_ID=MMETSP0270-20121206/64864_1 /TAXON_ID=71861 /ORGANISM="Scrippsiella trochoidea, Strain CCMP3099" /LENGTH=153 /DNA_ID=CAMNT_0002709327 /DNA_START=1 /DNA_END=463 /DNA_ORIENTATION=-
MLNATEQPLSLWWAGGARRWGGGAAGGGAAAVAVASALADAAATGRDAAAEAPGAALAVAGGEQPTGAQPRICFRVVRRRLACTERVIGLPSRTGVAQSSMRLRARCGRVQGSTCSIVQRAPAAGGALVQAVASSARHARASPQMEDTGATRC